MKRVRSDSRRQPLSATERDFRITKLDGLIDNEDQGLLEDLEDGLRIEEHALEESLQQQPGSFYAVSKHLALLISRRDAAKQYRETVEARVDGHLRRSAREQEEKKTEKEIEGQKLVHADVVKATNSYLELAQAVLQFQALKEAFQQRSYVLKDLVSLYLANYYGDVSGGRYSNQLRDRNADEAKDAMQRVRRGKVE